MLGLKSGKNHARNIFARVEMFHSPLSIEISALIVDLWRLNSFIMNIRVRSVYHIFDPLFPGKGEKLKQSRGKL